VCVHVYHVPRNFFTFWAFFFPSKLLGGKKRTGGVRSAGTSPSHPSLSLFVHAYVCMYLTSHREGSAAREKRQESAKDNGKCHEPQRASTTKKYSHVCISPITAAEAGEQGPDVDSHGNSLWFCNKLFSLSKKQKTAIGRVRTRNTVSSFMGRLQQRVRPSVNEPQRTTRRREMSWRRLRIRQDPIIRQPRIRQVRAAVQPCQDRALEQPLNTPSLTKNCVWGRWLVGE
jgi:hypothetical protein